MIYIKKVFLDGTALDDLCTVAEFSPLHPTPAISWAVGSDKPDGKQAWYELTLTDAETGRTFFDGDFACAANAVAKAGAVRFEGQGVAKIRYVVDGETFDSHYLYGGPGQKYVGEKKINFADYRRWMGL